MTELFKKNTSENWFANLLDKDGNIREQDLLTENYHCACVIAEAVKRVTAIRLESNFKGIEHDESAASDYIIEAYNFATAEAEFKCVEDVFSARVCMAKIAKNPKRLSN